MRRVLAGLVAVVLVGFAGVGYRFYGLVRRTTIEWETFRFAVPVAEGYLPEVRRKIGVWPTDLVGFDRYISPGGGWQGAAGDTALRVYRESFQRLEVLNQSSKIYTYRLILKQATMTCTSTVNPEGGSCRFAEK